MPTPLTTIEEIDILLEIQNPLFTYSAESLDEQLALSKYILSISDKRILLLGQNLFTAPYLFAGVKESHIEVILREVSYNLKKDFISVLSDAKFLSAVTKFISELDHREKTTENSARFKNILQYLEDNRLIV